MPEFKGAFSVVAPQEEVWRLLLDVRRLASSIPGCEKVEEVDDSTFKARIKVKVGPISTTQNVTFRLTELDPPHHLASEGRGNDPVLGSKVDLKASVDLRRLGETETQVHYFINVKVLGSLGMLGDAVMRKKAKEVSDEFAQRLKASIEENEAI